MGPPPSPARPPGSPSKGAGADPDAPSSGIPGFAAVAQVTSGLRRAGTQVKRMGRKILGSARDVPLAVVSGNRHGARLFPSTSGTDAGDDPDEAVVDKFLGFAPDSTAPGPSTPAAPDSSRKSRYGLMDPRRLGASSYSETPDPPEGYVNLWCGDFRRWQKRWLVASTPGVLIMYRRSSKLGPSTSIDLTTANVVVPDGGHPRQFLIVTSESLYRVRVLVAASRAPWVECIKSSAEKFERARALVRSRSGAANGGGGGGGGRSSPGALTVRTSADEGATSKERPSAATLRAALRDAYLVPLEGARAAVANALETARNETTRSDSVGWAEKLGMGGPSSEPRERADPLDDLGARVDALASGAERALEGAIARCATAEAERDRLRARNARLVAALAEVTGVAIAGEEGTNARADPFEASAATSKPPPEASPFSDASLGGPLQRSTSLPSPTGKGPSGHGAGGGSGSGRKGVVTVVTPGQASAFSRALMALPRGDESDSASDSSDSAGDSSGEFGSAMSFKSARTSSSFAPINPVGAPETSGALMADDEYVAAVEVINKHDYAVATHARSHSTAVGLASAMKPQTGSKKSETTHRIEGSSNERDPEGGSGGVAAAQPAGGSSSSPPSKKFESSSPSRHLRRLSLETVSDDEGILGKGSGSSSDASDGGSGSDDGSDGWTPRARLPAPAPVNQTFSLWGILKQAMGKDLSRVSMPANINQPLGILQKMVEDFEYLDLLYRAIDDFGPGVDRMAALAGFVASSYSSWFPRAQKPFAPTLGETYDWRSPDGRVRVVCEQVSYADPPVAAFRAEGVTPGGVPFEIDGEGAGVSKFWGKYVQVLVQGGLHMRLPRTNETFSWSKASMHVHNVVSGRVWIDMVGEFQVVAHESGERADLKLLKGAKPEPGKPERRGFVQGAVFDAEGRRAALVAGNVLGELRATRDPGYDGNKEPLTSAFHGDGGGKGASHPPIFSYRGVAPDAQRQYGFTRFAVALNELDPEASRNVPPTDSRLRPDMRALEDGFPERASAEKVRVEDRNRALAQARKKRKEKYQPAWFAKRNAEGNNFKGRAFGKHVNFLEHGVSLWVYQGKYWAQRETGEFVDPPVGTDPERDVFALGGEYQARRNAARRRREKKSQREKKEKESAKREEERAVPEGREDAEDAEEANEDER